MSIAGRFTASYEILILLASISVVFAGSSCAPPPIPIRIGNVTLSTGETARGLDVSVGSPPQSFAFLPQWPLNNTFLYGTNGDCDPTFSTAACTTFRGGQYDEFATTTRGVANTNTHPNDAYPYPDMTFISDDFALNANATMANYPLGIAQADWGEQGYYPQMAMGLGANSTILNALSGSGEIASRSWSMFWGRTGATAETQLDGSFVFGLFEGIQSTAISACIVPNYPMLMTIPFDPYFQNFESFTGQVLSERSFGLNYYGMLYNDTPGVEVYKGDLTIGLDSGFSARIPNDQLVVPDITIDHKTGALIANSSTPELVLNSIQETNAGDLAQLGRQFLTAGYLMLNQDAQKFTLWQANPTLNEDLAAVDKNNNVIDTFCSTLSTPNNDSSSNSNFVGSNNSTATPSAVPNSIATQTRRVSAGAIAGAVIGSFTAFGLATVLLFWFMRRRKQQREKVEGDASAGSPPEKRYSDPFKIPHFIPQELQSTSLLRESLDRHEMAA